MWCRPTRRWRASGRWRCRRPPCWCSTGRCRNRTAWPPDRPSARRRPSRPRAPCRPRRARRRARRVRYEYGCAWSFPLG
ncbi:hypothetical protein FRZ03_27155 [Streptomyces misionensis]|uniref:Uncharacterized protein n=1 Tax=Streptomyces misionensis TaxID=67331 RepID=A0A5C6J3E7_9ACTN|nr:hypothetical protein FRZ03_27155 [Streptomyces misionensis]